MCKEASNYDKWLFQERTSTDPEPLSEKKSEEKPLANQIKNYSIRASP
jgi:hypothetical protein